MNKKYMKEPYELIEKKLQLAELTIELGQVTREKWKRLETMRDVLQREEDIIREIADLASGLSDEILKDGSRGMANFDLGNLLLMFLESTDKIIKHLEENHPDRALTRAKKTKDALRKLINYCVGEYHDGIERKL